MPDDDNRHKELFEQARQAEKAVAREWQRAFEATRIARELEENNKALRRTVKIIKEESRNG